MMVLPEMRRSVRDRFKTQRWLSLKAEKQRLSSAACGASRWSDEQVYLLDNIFPARCSAKPLGEDLSTTSLSRTGSSGGRRGTYQICECGLFSVVFCIINGNSYSWKGGKMKNKMSREPVLPGAPLIHRSCCLAHHPGTCLSNWALK